MQKIDARDATFWTHAYVLPTADTPTPAFIAPVTPLFAHNCSSLWYIISACTHICTYRCYSPYLSVASL